MQTDIIQRTFFPGDEWSYFRIYTGRETADRLISEAVLPLATHLEREGLIDKWHFIRFGDESGWHVRVRFLHTKEQAGQVLQKANAWWSEFTQAGLIWKISMDTYTRELERYGQRTMELSEDLFHSHSEMVAQVLPHLTGEEHGHHRWLFGLIGIDSMLNGFEYSLAEKLYLMERIKTGYAHEFNADKMLRRQLGDKYRQQEDTIANVMHYTRGPVTDLLDEMRKPLVALSNHTADVFHTNQQIRALYQQGQLELSIDELLSSYLHMHMIRLFKAKQRVHELVIYDFLYRYYHSSYVRQEKSKAKKLSTSGQRA